MPDPRSEPHEYCVVHDQPLDWCRDAEACRALMAQWGLYDSREQVRERAAAAIAELRETVVALEPQPRVKYTLHAHRGVIEALKACALGPDPVPSPFPPDMFGSINVFPEHDWAWGRYELRRNGIMIMTGVLLDGWPALGGAASA
jgi:hypothetical protein